MTNDSIDSRPLETFGRARSPIALGCLGRLFVVALSDVMSSFEKGGP